MKTKRLELLESSFNEALVSETVFQELTTNPEFQRMAREVLFSKETYSDSWYSGLFSTYMSEDHNHRFRTEWLKEYARRGITKAWIFGENIQLRS